MTFRGSFYIIFVGGVHMVNYGDIGLKNFYLDKLEKLVLLEKEIQSVLSRAVQLNDEVLKGYAKQTLVEISYVEKLIISIL